MDAGPGRHDPLTIIGMAVIASGLATLLHEGIGHGLMDKPETSLFLFVRRQVLWWIAALVLGGIYIAVLGPGIRR